MLFNDFYNLKLRFELEATKQCRLPEYLGSTIRGVIGHGLKDAACIQRNKLAKCEECEYFLECPYTKLFHGLKIDFLKINRKVKVPNPYIVLPEKSKINYYKGDRLVFDLTLFGESIPYFEYFVFAVFNIEKLGLGIERVPFKMMSVKNVNHNELIAVKEKVIVREPVVSVFKYSKLNRKYVTLNFNTNLRLKYQNQLNNDLPFHILVNSIFRRVSYLNEYYYGCANEYDKYEIIEESKKVKCVENNLKWDSRERYSNKQKQKNSISGLSGSIIYKIDSNIFDEILQIGELVHVGSLTTMGLGKYTII